jgi:VIT1/CCC1 family predicted Fe2+/Mn2+ transporter
MHHEEEHFESSHIVKDIVIGMSDGLTVPFALAAGLSGAVSSTAIILTAGIAEIIAGSIAMGLGGYLSGRTEIDHYNSELKREYDEVEKMPEKEKHEVKEILIHYGLSNDAAIIVVDGLSKDKNKWVDFMMKFELGLDKPDANRARKSAVTIALSYIAGGLIPLSPYYFVADAQTALYYSCGVTLICLFAFGYFKSKATGQPLFTGALKVTAIGALAAAAAFTIAKLFHVG